MFMGICAVAAASCFTSSLKKGSLPDTPLHTSLQAQQFAFFFLISLTRRNVIGKISKL